MNFLKVVLWLIVIMLVVTGFGILLAVVGGVQQ